MENLSSSSYSTQTITYAEHETSTDVLFKKYRYFVMKRKTTNDIIDENLSNFFSELDQRVLRLINDNADQLDILISKCIDIGEDKETCAKYLLLGIIKGVLNNLIKELETVLNNNDRIHINEFLDAYMNSNNNHVNQNSNQMLEDYPNNQNNHVNQSSNHMIEDHPNNQDNHGNQMKQDYSNDQDNYGNQISNQMKKDSQEYGINKFH